MTTANVKQSKWGARNNGTLANLPRLRNAAEHKLLDADLVVSTFNAAVLAANVLSGTLGDALGVVEYEDPRRFSDHGAPLKRTMVGFEIASTGAYCCPRHMGPVAYRDIRDNEIKPVYSGDDHGECKGCNPDA